MVRGGSRIPSRHFPTHARQLVLLFYSPAEFWSKNSIINLGHKLFGAEAGVASKITSTFKGQRFITSEDIQKKMPRV